MEVDGPVWIQIVEEKGTGRSDLEIVRWKSRGMDFSDSVF